MVAKLLISGMALTLATSAMAYTNEALPASERTIVATLQGEAAEKAFFAMGSDCHERSYELHSAYITHRSNDAMSCREFLRNTAKYSCVVFAAE